MSSALSEHENAGASIASHSEKIVKKKGEMIDNCESVKSSVAT